MKQLLIVMTFVVISITSFSQNAGDYRSIGDGFWNANGTWQMYNGSTWISATAYPGQNAGTHGVFIQNEHDITLTASVPNPIDSLRIGLTGTDGTLTFNAPANISLAVNGYIRVDDGKILVNNSSGANVHTLSIGGDLSVGLVGGGGNDVFKMTIDGSNDVCNVIFTGTNVSISENGSTNTIVFNNVTFANNGSAFIQTNIDDIVGIMTVNAGSLLVPGELVVIGDNNSGTITGAGTLYVTRLGTYTSQYNLQTHILTGLTVDYSASGSQTISGMTYGTLVISGSGIKTLGGSATVNDVFTIESGALVTLPAGSLIISLSSAIVNINGTIEFTSTASYIINTAGVSTLVMGENGLIKTRSLGGLGPAAPATDNPSLVNAVGAGITFNTNISTVGTVEYYRDADTPVTDRDYNNLVISNTGIRTWTIAAARVVNGNFTIDANARLTLTGGQTINLKGNWIKNSSAAFTQGATTIAFNGSTLQSIGGSALTSFTNVQFNNSAPDIAILLNGTVSVTGSATFTDGLVGTTNGALLSFADNATATGAGLNQATDASYVVGPVLKTGNDAFIFPVGSLLSGTYGGYMPLTITAPDNVLDAFRATYFRIAASSFGPSVPPLLSVSDCDHWSLDEITAAGTANSLSVVLSFDDGSECSPILSEINTNGLVVARFNGTSWSVAGTGSTTVTGNSTVGTVRRDNITAFGRFALGNTLDEAPLPVLFTDVKAYKKSSGVQVEWTNMTEKDVVSYMVERSFNGTDFTTVAVVLPRSNNDDKQSYSFLDLTPSTGVNFYRVKVSEKSTKIVYSKLLKVDISNGRKEIVLYPNPVTGNSFSVNFSGSKGFYSIRVVNAAGQSVYVKQLDIQGDNFTQNVVLPASVKPGVYTLSLTSDGNTIYKLFVVK